jgi:hypothetical protein
VADACRQRTVHGGGYLVTEGDIPWFLGHALVCPELTAVAIARASRSTALASIATAVFDIACSSALYNPSSALTLEASHGQRRVGRAKSPTIQLCWTSLVILQLQ